MSYAIASIGFGLCFYGLTPLSGSNPLDGFVSERGALSFLLGLAVLVAVGCAKVLP